MRQHQMPSAITTLSTENQTELSIRPWTVVTENRGVTTNFQYIKGAAMLVPKSAQCAFIADGTRRCDSISEP
jgi:predicted subunit of tRNA(5-methylaminomethyl-2-thiouridylate) methyltransferase